MQFFSPLFSCFFLPVESSAWRWVSLNSGNQHLTHTYTHKHTHTQRIEPLACFKKKKFKGRVFFPFLARHLRFLFKCENVSALCDLFSLLSVFKDAICATTTKKDKKTASSGQCSALSSPTPPPPVSLVEVQRKQKAAAHIKLYSL